MEGISLSLPLPVVLHLVLLYPFVSLFLFVCGSFIYFSLLVIVLYLSWPTLLFACLLSLSSLIVFLFYLCQYFFFFACLFPPAFPINAKPLIPYFNDNFQILCLIIPFCEEVTGGSKGNSFPFLKLQKTIPTEEEFGLASLLKKVQTGEVGKEMLMANSENLLEREFSSAIFMLLLCSPLYLFLPYQHFCRAGEITACKAADREEPSRHWHWLRPNEILIRYSPE